MAEAEDKTDFGTEPKDVVERWLAEIKAYEGVFRNWQKRSGKVVRRYRDEKLDLDSDFDKSFDTKNFNIFWSNVQTLQPALLTDIGRVTVRRRNRDRNPVALAAAQILQRSTQYSIQQNDYEPRFKYSRDDYLMTARGTVWVRYVPTFGEERNADLPVTRAEDGSYLNDKNEPLSADVAPNVQQLPDGAFNLPGGGEPYRPVIEEKVLVDHVIWSEFGHTPAPTWDLVTAVWRRAELTREQLVERFGEKIGRKVNLTKKSTGIDEAATLKFGDTFKRGEVYEIWDKSEKKAIWISPGYSDGPLDEKDDPLHLREFFPCPRPLYGTMTTNTLVPVPDYLEYQAQAVQIDILTQRIDRLTSALKVAGAYDASFPALEQLIKGGENTLIPVSNWAMFAEKGGLVGAISFMPIKDIADVLVKLMEVRNQVKSDLYEVTGLSDIVRGQSSPSTSATAERLKGKFVSLRLQDRQKEMTRFIRDTLALAAEIMAEHFDPKTLIEISGWLSTANAQALGPRAQVVAVEAVTLLKDDRLRTFQIDVETDATSAEDVQVEKQQRVEFLTAVSQFLQNALPAAEKFPEVAPLLGEMLMYGVRAFDKGSDLEEVFERTIEQMQAARGQRSTQNAEHQAAMGEVQAKLQKVQADAQLGAQELALKQSDQQFMHNLRTQELSFNQSVKVKELQNSSRELEISMQELQLKMRELDLKFEELALEREKIAQTAIIEGAKLNDMRVARQEERDHEGLTHERDRSLELTDAADQRHHEMQMRRLDGMATPTMEDTVNTTGESVTQLITTLGDLVKQQGQNNDNMTRLIQTLAAPRMLMRDPKTNAIAGSRLDFQTEGTA